MHFFTLETAHTTHYFFAQTRDAQIDNQDLTEKINQISTIHFLQDEEAIAWIEDFWVNDENSDYTEFSIHGDRAGLQMRKIITRRAKEEMEEGQTG